MTPLNPASLKPGDVLRQAIYTPRGAKVLARGTTLTPARIAALRANHARLVLGFPADRRAARPRREEPAVELPTIDEGETAGPTTIAPAAWRRHLRLADAFVGERADRWSGIPLRTSDALEPFAPEMRPRDDDSGAVAYFREAEQRRADWTVNHARTLASIAAGQRVELAGETMPLLDELLRHFTADPCRFPALALNPSRSADYLPSHALAVSMLAICVASRMGHDEEHVRLAAIAALFCDVGMAALSSRLLASDQPLDEVSLNRVRRHSSLSVAMLAATTAIDERALLIIHQHHEREDASGYPRALRSAAIHDLAKVLAVADVFAAATAYRPYRIIQHRPADGIAETVRLANAGALDRATTLALLEAVGRYPVGSYVRLSDASRALVVAANPDHIDRPVVHRVARDPAEEERVDLAKTDARLLWISGPVDPPAPALTGLCAA